MKSDEPYWHYGPTASDPSPGKMWCSVDKTEVYFIEDAYICHGRPYHLWKDLEDEE